MTTDLVIYCVKADLFFFFLSLKLPFSKAYSVLLPVSWIVFGIKFTKHSFMNRKSTSLVLVTLYIRNEPPRCGSRWIRLYGYQDEWILIQIFKAFICWEGRLCRQIVIIQWDQSCGGTMSIGPQGLGGVAQRSLCRRDDIWAGLCRESRSLQGKEGHSRQQEQCMQQRLEAGGQFQELHVVWRSWNRGCVRLLMRLWGGRGFVLPWQWAWVLDQYGRDALKWFGKLL